MDGIGKWVLVAAAMVLSAPVLAASVETSGATAASVNLSAAGVVQATAVIAPVSGAAGVAYDTHGGASATSQSWLLVNGIVTNAYEALSLGAATTEASASTNGLPSATGTTTIANVGSTLKTITTGVALVGLGITADAIASTSTAAFAADGSLTGTHSATITNLGISGTILSGLTLDLVALANAAPNTVAINLLGLKLVVNEQSQALLDTRDLLVQTNALHLTLSNFSYGGSILSGEVILGHSQAEVAAVPEPESWGMMMIGFGAIGLAMRRSRASGKGPFDASEGTFTRSLTPLI